MNRNERAATWPLELLPELEALQRSLAIGDQAFDELLAKVGQLAEWTMRRAAAKRETNPAEAFALGLTGAQGSGKTTLARLLALLLAKQGLRSASLSLDDIYLTYDERQQLQASCPFYRFRGPFGTHDVELGLSVLRQLKYCRSGESVRVPVFDKSLQRGAGDRLPPDRWREVAGPLDLVIFEGWCLGARPVADDELAEPINAIEAAPEYDDTRGAFRRRLNAELRHYGALFAELDDLAVLHVGSVERIYRWRMQQEQALKRQAGAGMDVATLRSFVDYFLPTTERYILPLGENPAGRAGVVLTLGADHRISELRFVAEDGGPGCMQ